MAISKYQTKGGPKWRVEIWEGKQRLASKAGFKKKKDAAKWQRVTLEQLEQAESDSCNLMLSRMFDDYILDCHARMQPGTVGQKKTVYESFAEYLGKDLPHDAVDVELAREFLAKTAERTTNIMANRYRRDLAACWNWHRQAEAINVNPWSKIKPYPEEKKIKYVPPAEDIDAIRLAASPEARDFIDCLYFLAARQGEILQLIWEDVNFERETVTLWTRKRRGGGREPRTLAMTDSLKSLLERRWRVRDKEGTHVFMNPETGNPYRRNSHFIKYMFNRLCKRAEVKHFTAHAIRHHVASRVNDTKKATPRQIQKYLGHKRLDTTEIYLHELEIDRGVADVLEFSTHEGTHEATGTHEKGVTSITRNPLKSGGEGEI